MWLDGLQGAASDLFNDPEALFSLMDQGRLFGNDENDEDAFDMLEAMKSILYASAIRPVWMSGSESRCTCVTVCCLHD